MCGPFVFEAPTIYRPGRKDRFSRASGHTYYAQSSKDDPVHKTHMAPRTLIFSRDFFRNNTKVECPKACLIVSFVQRRINRRQ